MQRTLLPLALIVMVLVGAWLIWPQPEPRAPLAPVSDSTQAPPASTGQSAPSATRLVVVCVAPTDQHPLAGVHVRATGSAEQVTASDGRAAFDVQPGIALTVSADDLEHSVSFETAELPALTPGETREFVFKAPPAR
jgi:hypothetical protein